MLLSPPEKLKKKKNILFHAGVISSVWLAWLVKKDLAVVVNWTCEFWKTFDYYISACR